MPTTTEINTADDLRRLKTGLEGVTAKTSLDEVHKASLIRALRATVDLVTRLSAGAAGEAAGAESDVDSLLRTLTSSPSVLKDLSPNPFSGAIARGIFAKRRLLESEGGTVSVDEAAKLLKVSRQAVHRRIQTKKVLAVSLGAKQYELPVWQFNPPSLRDVMPHVLESLSALDSLMQATFFLSENGLLGGRRPLDLLREGKTNEVIQVAASYGGQEGT